MLVLHRLHRTVKVIWSTRLRIQIARATLQPGLILTPSTSPLHHQHANGSSTVNCAALAVAPTPPAVNDACGNALTRCCLYCTDSELVKVIWSTRFTVFIQIARATLQPGLILTPSTSRHSPSARRTDRLPSTAPLSSAVAPTPPAVNDACGNALTPVMGYLHRYRIVKVIWSTRSPIRLRGQLCYVLDLYLHDRHPPTSPSARRTDRLPSTAPLLLLRLLPPAVMTLCGNATHAGTGTAPSQLQL